MKMKKKINRGKKVVKGIDLKSWMGLIIDKKEIKSQEDSQKILREMRYGSLCS